MGRIIALALLFLPIPAFAMGGNETFYYALLEGDIGINENDDTVYSWDGEAWIGGDINKFLIKAEGEANEDDVENAEVQFLWSRMIAPFWDLHAGVRHDFEPGDLSYAVIGVEGVAPYLFEVEAAAFLSEDGDVTARAEVEYELVFTQRLIGSPYVELDFAASDIPDQHMGAGLTTGEAGFQLRYEITRKFAPYVEVTHERAFGETRILRAADGDETEATILRAGLRLIF